MEFHLLGVFPLDVGWAGAVQDWDSSHRTGGFSLHIQGDWLGGFPWEGGLENPGKGAWKSPGKGAWKSQLGSLNPFVFPAEKELWSRDFLGAGITSQITPDLGLDLGLDPWLSPLVPDFPNWKTTGSNPFSLPSSGKELFP